MSRDSIISLAVTCDECDYSAIYCNEADAIADGWSLTYQADTENVSCMVEHDLCPYCADSIDK